MLLQILNSQFKVDLWVLMDLRYIMHFVNTCRRLEIHGGTNSSTLPIQPYICQCKGDVFFLHFFLSIPRLRNLKEDYFVCMNILFVVLRMQDKYRSTWDYQVIFTVVQLEYLQASQSVQFLMKFQPNHWYSFFLKVFFLYSQHKFVFFYSRFGTYIQIEVEVNLSFSLLHCLNFTVFKVDL